MIGKPLVVILGATAVGKTRLAIDLATTFNGEIISADSRQIYRHMDIGTAKATPEEQAQIPHHLIDVVNPDETLTLAQYQDMAYHAIDHLHTLGRLPFLVGGTGQYLTAIIEGWSIPRVPPNWTLRQQLEDYAEREGVHALHAKLIALDEDYALKTHPNNVRRVIRALEVCIQTGQTMTEAQRKRPPPYHIYTIGLRMARPTLYQRADERVDAMIQDGLLEEVAHLLAIGYSSTLPAMSAVGYLEIIAHLTADLSLEEATQRIKYNTHDFIRRQDVWFKGHDNGIMWHNIDEIGAQKLTTLLNTHIHAWLEKGNP